MRFSFPGKGVSLYLMFAVAVEIRGKISSSAFAFISPVDFGFS